jgi:hypothetical protein
MSHITGRVMNLRNCTLMIFMICILHQIWCRWSNQELDGLCTWHEGAYRVLVGIPEGKRPCGRPRHGLDWSGWLYRQVAGSCEHSKELSGNFLTSWGTKRFKDFLPWNESASHSAQCIDREDEERNISVQPIVKFNTAHDRTVVAYNKIRAKKIIDIINFLTLHICKDTAYNKGFLSGTFILSS